MDIGFQGPGEHGGKPAKRGEGGLEAPSLPIRAPILIPIRPARSGPPIRAAPCTGEPIRGPIRAPIRGPDPAPIRGSPIRDPCPIRASGSSKVLEGPSLTESYLGRTF